MVLSEFAISPRTAFALTVGSFRLLWPPRTRWGETGSELHHPEQEQSSLTLSRATAAGAGHLGQEATIVREECSPDRQPWPITDGPSRRRICRNRGHAGENGFLAIATCRISPVLE